MASKTVSVKKDFDAVAFMRKQRDRISRDIASMDFEEIKEYFSKKGAIKRSSPKKN